VSTMTHTRILVDDVDLQPRSSPQRGWVTIIFSHRTVLEMKSTRYSTWYLVRLYVQYNKEHSYTVLVIVRYKYTSTRYKMPSTCTGTNTDKYTSNRYKMTGTCVQVLWKNTQIGPLSYLFLCPTKVPRWYLTLATNDNIWCIQTWMLIMVYIRLHITLYHEKIDLKIQKKTFPPICTSIELIVKFKTQAESSWWDDVLLSIIETVRKE
jgi:hypothetical protein